MRIALVHPSYWPEVRRGSERLIHDLGTTLAARGHEVTLLTTHPGSTRTDVEDGITVVRTRRLPQRGPLRWYEHYVTVAPSAFGRLATGSFDVAHAFFTVDSWAAVLASRFGGPPVVASVHGILDREWLVKRRYRLEMLDLAARRAEAVSVLSEAAAAPYERYLGRRPLVLPGGVLAERFQAADEPDPRPTLICAASLGDPRKRGPLLFEAFGLLRAQVPDARLLVTAVPDPVLSGDVGELPDGAELLAADSPAALDAAFARAWASVLPSVDEAFGLVLLESMAAGTPVVAARSGAAPEVIADDAGLLFDPDDAVDLARAMAGALDLARDSGTADACRRAARRWEWGSVVERYEAAYDAAVSASGSR